MAIERLYMPHAFLLRQFIQGENYYFSKEGYISDSEQNGVRFNKSRSVF
jgi:hypothetical protein